MLRINELKLPLNHPEPALRAAILARLGIADGDLIDFSVFKRSYDARKKNSEITFVYIIDAATEDTEIDQFGGGDAEPFQDGFVQRRFRMVEREFDFGQS